MTNSDFIEIDYSDSSVRQIGIGMLGSGFMGKVHSNAYLKMPYTTATPPAYPKLIAMCGRDQKKLIDTARRFGYLGIYPDWKQMIHDPRIEIVDNCTPDDLHCEPTIAAAEAGKHVICEKPAAMSSVDTKNMFEAAKNANVKHMVCHNYRFIPAVRFAKELIEDGKLGEIYQFRGRYLQEVGHDPDQVVENTWYAAGTASGVLLGIGSHVIDMARFLVGEMTSVNTIVKTPNSKRADQSGTRKTITADEESLVLVEFDSGAIGTIESSGISTGRKNQLAWEINGSKGSALFDLEDPNHLLVCLDDGKSRLKGFTEISVTDPSHPLQTMILPPGHNCGWEYGHVHAINHFVDCVVNNKSVAPYGATLEDGHQTQLIMEAIQASSKSRQIVKSTPKEA